MTRKGVIRLAAIFFRSILIYIFLAFALKIMGKRQLSELEVSELVSTLVVSEVAAIPIADPDIPLLNPSYFNSMPRNYNFSRKKQIGKTEKIHRRRGCISHLPRKALAKSA